MAVRGSLTAAAVRRPSQALAPAGPAKGETAETKLTPSRRGKKQLSFWVEPAARQQLKLAAVHQERSEQDILREALDDWFGKQGLHRLARG